MRKNVLIIGSGGREHALGWKLRQSPNIGSIYFAPGNGGTQEIGKNIDIAANGINNLVKWVKTHSIDLTVVGPEEPLSKGIADIFLKQNLSVFGPTKKAARLESSKAWSDKFMQRHNIPHPKSYIFTDIKKAKKFIKESKERNWVIKADGLAAGKGVYITGDPSDSIKSIDLIMKDKIFGKSGNKILIQEKLIGREISLLAFTDGKTVVPLLPSQDHKRIFDQDKGANTGGMGAYAPLPFVSKQLLDDIEKNLVQATIKGLQQEGIDYRGIIYLGLMLTKEGPKVLEYNVRFGDPETQPLMHLLESDLLSVMEDCINGKLKKNSINFRKGSAVCIVLASEGYPCAYKKGDLIYGLDEDRRNEFSIFHAGTVSKNGNVYTNGGRVLGITSHAGTLQKALDIGYKSIGRNKIHFRGMQYRKDIAKKD